MKTIGAKKRDQKQTLLLIFLFLLSLCSNFVYISCDKNSNEINADSIKECPVDKPVYVASKNDCFFEYCAEKDYSNNKCFVTNPTVKKQLLGDFLYSSENGSPIYTSFGRNSDGDIFMECSLGVPYSQKHIYTLKSDGREYIDGIRKNEINMDSNIFSKNGVGVIVSINGHKCYLKLSYYEAIEMYDFDEKKFTSAKFEEIFGYKVISSKNTLLITNQANIFIYAYITADNYLIMQKFKVISNEASNCIQIIKTLKENVKAIPNNSRTCMITTKQYIECLDIDENQMYVVRVYDSNLNFLKQFELEKNNAPANKAGSLYHETVFLKGEISIFIYYVDTSESNAKPIMVLKKLSVTTRSTTLSNLNNYLNRDIVYGNVDYTFSDTEHSLAIFNEYYFGLSSFTLDKKNLIVTLFNIFNNDKTIDTHYFNIPLKELYNIEYQSGIQAFGYKNAYGIQMNFIRNSENQSGFIVFGYANTTDPQSVNNLFDKYTSYTIKVRDYYTGIQNNIFCYVFVHLVITKIPSQSYFNVKTKNGAVLKVGSIISLDEELTITKKSSSTKIPKGRYVLGIAPYLNEADYEGFVDCSYKVEMFGEKVPTNWYPDEFYGRTIEFKFTSEIDCYENCDACTTRGLTLDDQQCDTCKYGFYFVENTKNCFGEPPDGYYFDIDKKIYSECKDNCKACTIDNNGNIQKCFSCKDNYLLFNHTNCIIDCKSNNKYLNYEQTECIDSVPDGFYVNDTEYNTIDKCYEKCLTCKGPLESDNMNCLTCNTTQGFYLLNNTNNCVFGFNPKTVYDDIEPLIICHYSCLNCSKFLSVNEHGESTNCDSCNNNLGFYHIENTTICTNGSRANTIFDENCKCYKKCYKDCLTCSDKEIDEFHMNCLTCNESNGYAYFSKSNNCLNCKSQGKYVNYEQTECINSIPDGYYVNDTEINTIDKCNQNCLTCNEGSINNENMKCLSCDNSNKYYFIENTNNCQKAPFPGYYLDETILKKCYADCQTCSGKEVMNEKGEILNMNCESCDESKGFYIKEGTKNCINEDENKCPKDKPILKNNQCTSEYCSKQEYEDKICKISNKIIKTQFIGDYPHVSHSEIPIYSTLGKNSDGYIFFESNLANPQSDRYLYPLKENGRGYIEEDGMLGIKINLNSNLFSKDGNGAIVYINGHQCYLKFSYNETIEVYDFDEAQYTFAKIKDLFGYEIKSIKNTLLRTNEENTFIYAYITNNNYLIMQKFKVVSNKASNCIQIIKTFKENERTISKDSRRCMITVNQYIECLDMNENQMYIIRIYDSNLNYINKYQLEQNNAPLERAIKTYHEAIWLKDEIGIFIYFTSTSEKSAKPLLILRKLYENNGLVYLDKLNYYLIKDTVFQNIPYTFSDIENSLAILNDHYFALASITESNEKTNKHLIISLFNLINDDKSIRAHYFIVPIKDLYNIDYYSGLQAFEYKNAYGIQFNHKKGNEYRTGFIIFGYGNSTDPVYKENIFDAQNSYTFKPSNYIKIENNIFCYYLVHIQITELPNTSTGIRVLKASNSEQLNVGDILLMNDEIKITYTGNKDDIPRGNFIVGFVPYLKGAKKDDLNECSSDIDIFGEQVNNENNPDEYYGRTAHFEFSVFGCFKNCKNCDIKGLNINNQKCKSCLDGYYFVQNSQNCFKIPPNGYYFNKEKEVFSKCYDYCLKCTDAPIINNKGDVTNMNCDLCDEVKGYYLISGTKNCEDKNKVYDKDNCPIQKPISKNNNCVLEYCTKEEYENKICSITNSIIKTQWIGNFPYICTNDSPLYSTLGQISNDEVIVESNSGNPLTDRKVYILNEDGRGYIDGEPSQIIDLKSPYFSTYGNAAIVYINEHKCFLRLSYHESIEIYDFNENKNTSAKLEDILGYEVKSYKNSLLRTNEENTFIYAYITRGNYLIMQKLKVVSNDASNCIQIIKTSLESVKTINKNSRRCLITVNQFIECLDMDENQMYVIRIYDSNLNYLRQDELEKNKAPKDRAFYTYHEAKLLKEEIGIFVYFNDISDYNAKPIFILKKLTVSNGIRNLENISPSFSAKTLYNTLPYYISDSENSLAIINDHYFALASITAYENRHLLIALLKVINDEKTLYANYFDIPIKEFYDINYYSNLESFGYKNGFGVKFDQKKGNEYKTGFILFGYGNSTDPTPINNIFINEETYIFKPSDYIKIENNIFCYVLDGVVITDIPDTSTGIKVLKVSNSQELKVGDFLSINEEIKITYTGNKDDVPRGKYIVGYKPHLKQPDEDKFYECSVDIDTFGENAPKTPNQEEYYGRTTHFEFTIGECFENCQTCLTKGNNLEDQKCETCFDNSYFIENTNNCFEKPPEGYYFNEEKKVYSKCYDKCKACSQINNGNIQNCLSCHENYLLYNSTNCLDCKSKGKYVNYEQTECITSIPDGYYANDTKYNTIDKCHQNCLTCKKAPLNDNNMNCLTCDKTNGFYKVENTNNCETKSYPGHYLEDNTLKKCHIACASCSSMPILNERGDVTNCEICNKDLGFYQVDNSKVCRNTTKEGEYFDEECKCYKKCYKDCLTCSGKEIDEYHMNCLSCDESKGYTYFSKTTNCLNCKSQGKLVNSEETECTDDINKTNICYEKCKTCSSYGDETSMNCLTCIPGFYLKDGNCVKTYTCPYKFFYQIKIDQNADMNQKICLSQNEVCPCALPFYYPHSNECVETCPLELLFNQGCKISNLSYGLSKVISLVKLYFSEGIIDYLTKTLSLNDINYLYELAVKISVYSLFSSYSNFFRNLEMNDKTYQSSNNENLRTINESNHLKGSDIDLGPCEQKLREYYNIPDDVQLTIIKVDLKKNDSSLNNVQYEVFNPRNRSDRLDLTICNEEKIIVKNTIDSSLDLRRISYMMESANNSIEIFSEDSQFFKDECSIFTSEYKTDVLIQDRYIEYNINNKICQSGCSLQKINITTGETFCSCQPIKGFTIINDTSDIEEIIKNNIILDNDKISEEVNYKKYSKVNAKVLKCVRNIGVDFFKNYILIIFTILLFGYIFISILQFSFSSQERKSNERINKIPKINSKENKESNKNDSKNEQREKSINIIDEGIITSKRACSRDKFDKTKKGKGNKKSEGICKKDSKNETDYSFLGRFFSSFKKRIIIFYCQKIKDFQEKLFLFIYALLNTIVTNAFFFTEKNIHQIYLDKGKYNFKYQIKYNTLATLISFLFILIAKLFINFNNIYPIKKEILEKIRYIFIGVSNCLFIFYWIYLGSLTSTYINAKIHLFINIFITTIFLFIINCLLALASSVLREKSFLRKIIDFL